MNVGAIPSGVSYKDFTRAAADQVDQTTCFANWRWLMNEGPAYSASAHDRIDLLLARDWCSLGGYLTIHPSHNRYRTSIWWPFEHKRQTPGVIRAYNPLKHTSSPWIISQCFCPTTQQHSAAKQRQYARYHWPNSHWQEPVSLKNAKYTKISPLLNSVLHR